MDCISRSVSRNSWLKWIACLTACDTISIWKMLQFRAFRCVMLSNFIYISNTFKNRCLLLLWTIAQSAFTCSPFNVTERTIMQRWYVTCLAIFISAKMKIRPNTYSMTGCTLWSYRIKSMAGIQIFAPTKSCANLILCAGIVERRILDIVCKLPRWRIFLDTISSSTTKLNEVLIHHIVFEIFQRLHLDIEYRRIAVVFSFF